MHFHTGDLDGLEGVKNRHAGVGVGGRVDDDAVYLVKKGLLYVIHQQAFMVGLFDLYMNFSHFTVVFNELF